MVSRRDCRRRQRADPSRGRLGLARVGRRARAHHGREGTAAGPRGEGDRTGRVLRRRDEGLRGDQLDPPSRDCGPRLRAARPHLQKPDLLDAAALHGRARRVGRARAGNAPVRRRRGHQRADRRHPARARLRRRHRLCTAPDRPFPRGASARRGQVRRDARRTASGRSGHRRLGRDRDRGVALPLTGQCELDRGSRPGWRDGSRDSCRRNADPAPRPAADRRPARVLAVRAPRRSGAPAGLQQPLAPARPDAREATASRMDRHDARSLRAGPRHPRPRRRPHDRGFLPGIGGVGSGPTPARPVFPGGGERPDGRSRHRPCEGRAGPDGRTSGRGRDTRRVAGAGSPRDTLRRDPGRGPVRHQRLPLDRAAPSGAAGRSRGGRARRRARPRRRPICVPPCSETRRCSFRSSSQSSS